MLVKGLLIVGFMNHSRQTEQAFSKRGRGRTTLDLFNQVEVHHSCYEVHHVRSSLTQNIPLQAHNLK
jgi:hypothetical protein